MSESYRTVPLFADLDDVLLAEIGHGSQDVSFSGGEIIFRRGGDARHFYLVERGYVAIEVVQPGSAPFMIETIGPGSVLGWSWLFPPYRWQFDARALEPVTGTMFDAEQVRVACDRDARLGYELMAAFSRLIIERLQFTRLRLLDVYGDAGR